MDLPTGKVDSENTLLLPKGSITVWLTSCLTGLDLTKQLNLLIVFIWQKGWIQTSQIGGQPHSDTSPCKVSECSLVGLSCLYILIFKNDLWSDRTHQLTICLTDFNKQHCYAKIINRFAYLVESKLVKQEVSHTVMLILLKWVISLHK